MCAFWNIVLVMSRATINKLNYIIAFITEFAKVHHISIQQAYIYLQQFRGLDFVDKYYEVEHTNSFENAVDDVTIYCHRMGGAIA